MPGEMCVEIGETSGFFKEVSDTDIAQFAAISGDFDPVHMDDEYAKTTPFGKRIAHGLFVMGLLSGAESEMSRRIVARGSELKPISLGYDKVRFIRPVFIGDTLKTVYTIKELNSESRRSTGTCEIFNQNDELCLVGDHIMKWV